MKRVVTAATAALMVLMVPALALADNHAPMPGQNLWNWLSDNILGAFPVILAAVSLYYLVRRAFAQFIGFAVFGALVAIFVYAPDLVREFGVRMGNLLLR